jgi:Rod binding domain-containing protein
MCGARTPACCVHNRVNVSEILAEVLARVPTRHAGVRAPRLSGVPMDISISPATDLAASSFSLTQSHDRSAIPANESFHQAFQAASDKTDTPEKISGVAKQFEALMIGQMLKSAREASGGGWLGSEDDQDDHTGSLVMELGEQGLSQALAAHGGLGIAKMVTANLERGHAKTPSSDSETPSPAPASSLKRRETSTEPNTDLKRR